MKRLGVTTSLQCSSWRGEEARQIAQTYGVPFMPRADLSLPKLSRRHDIETWLVYEEDEVLVWQPQGTYRFHLNMAELRIRTWDREEKDYLASLMLEVQPQRIFDGTFGKGSDAVVAAYVSGRKIVATEASLPLFLVAQEGLRRMEHPKNSRITEALRNIELHYQEAGSFLASVEDGYWDIAYFDFMFNRTVTQSTNLGLLRHLALQPPRDRQWWQQVLRTVGKRLIIKLRSSETIAELPAPTFVVGGKYSRVKYGVWDL